jgi:hypothetical protein
MCERPTDTGVSMRRTLAGSSALLVMALHYHWVSKATRPVTGSGATRSDFDGDQAGYASGTISRFHGSSGGLVPQSGSWSGQSLRTDRLWPLRYGMRIAGPSSGGPLF